MQQEKYLPAFHDFVVICHNQLMWLFEI